MSTSDETLLQRIADAQVDALSDLYDRYGRLVFSLALYMTGDAGMAEEITQDVFLQVWQKAGSYRSELGRATTWLTSIARHRTIDLLRRQRVRPEGSWVGLDELHPDQTIDPAAVEPEVLLRGLRGRVRRALNDLPADQRTALALAYFQGLTQREIADMLGEPLGTVKTRIRMGMRKLRQLLIEEQVWK
ncbi:MAG TPA: sigma-70 family RNA polymerase sigma factor [Anaerolineaceae bacterium]|nr:sigma-70 family RNA polymerase sigma factor [Anaerolineaceae bacterium]